MARGGISRYLTACLQIFVAVGASAVTGLATPCEGRNPNSAFGNRAFGVPQSLGFHPTAVGEQLGKRGVSKRS